jgi:hypothetical protein
MKSAADKSAAVNDLSSMIKKKAPEKLNTVTIQVPKRDLDQADGTDTMKRSKVE